MRETCDHGVPVTLLPAGVRSRVLDHGGVLTELQTMMWIISK